MAEEPTADELRALLAGEISPKREREISAVLETSPDLRSRLEELSGAEDFNSEYQPATFRGDDGGVPAMDSPFDPPTISPGQKIGRFQIIETTGEGGMGIVLRAVDLDLNRVVALKILSPRLSGNGDAASKFREEASAIAAIDHEHVLPIYDICEESGFLFFVTRFVEGETLAARLRNHPDGLPIDEAAGIGRAVSLALEAAHAAGIVHRDVKPSNILLENDGKIWLMDFGLAAEASQQLAGTPHFMSPEQASGKGAGPASDLFSLGSVLFHMLAGHPPFYGDDLRHVLWQVTHLEVKSIDRTIGPVPVWLQTLTLRLLEKAKENRPGSAAEVARVFHSKFLTASQRRARRVRWGLGALTAMFLLAGGYGIYQWRQTHLLAHPFHVIDGGRFKTLRQAVAEVPPGGVIEIRSNEAHLMSYQSWDRPVTLRAGGGFHPVLKYIMTSRPTWTVHEDFLAEGMTFTYTQGEDDHGTLIEVHSENFTVRNCRFVMPKYTGERIDSAPVRAFFKFSKSENVLIERNEFNSIQATIATLPASPEDTGRNLIFRENFAVCRGFLIFQFPVAGTPPVMISAHGNVIHANNVFVFRPYPGRTKATFGRVTIEAEGNLFQSNGGTLYTLPNLFPALRSSVDWTGNDNIYAAKYPINLEGDNTTVSQLPRTIEEWRDYHDSPENNSVLTGEKLIEIQVYEDSGESRSRPAVRNPEVADSPFLKEKAKFRFDRIGPEGIGKR